MCCAALVGKIVQAVRASIVRSGRDDLRVVRTATAQPPRTPRRPHCNRAPPRPPRRPHCNRAPPPAEAYTFRGRDDLRVVRTAHKPAVKHLN